MQTTRTANPQPEGGALYYLRGAWLFFRRMWPAIYDLSTAEAWVYASAIAFNALLSFFAFLTLIGNVLENQLGWHEGYVTIYRLMTAIAPREAQPMFDALDNVTRGLHKGASVYSILALVFTSTGVFLPLELALNRAWQMRPTRSTFKQYVVYLPLVIICAVVILGFVALASVWNQILAGVVPFPRAQQFIFNSTSALFAVPSATLIFFLIYYWLPNGLVPVRRVFFSAAAMAMLWTLMTFAYRLLLPMLNFRSRYDNLSAVVTIITWIFISAFILLLGANLSAREILPRAWIEEAQPKAQNERDELAAQVAVEK